jgi:hypothetical protein
MECHTNKNNFCCWIPPQQRRVVPTGPGILRIVKNTIGGDGTFNFNINPPANGTGTVSITTSNSFGSIDIPGVQSGFYTITEVPQLGWTGTSEVTVFVPSNSIGIATFTNTTLGTLTINKIIIGGETGLFNFVVTPPTLFTNILVTGGTGSVSIPNLPTGIYTVLEFSTPGFIGPLAEVAFVPPGGTGSVTFTNTVVPIIPGTLIIDKIALGGNDTFTFSIIPNAGGTGTFSITTTGSATGGSGSLTINDVTPGAYGIVELPVPGWETQLITIVNVPNGGIGTATITNAKLGTLVIDKVAIGGDSTFNYTITPPAGFSGGTASVSITTIGGTGSITIPSVNPGLYDIVEASQPGWTGTTEVIVTVPPGATGTATFTNTNRGILVIDKIALGGDSTFDFTITPPAGGTGSVAITTIGGTGSIDIPNVLNGSYLVTEIGQTGWIIIGNTAMNVSISPGSTGTVTFTNSKLGDLVIDKTTSGDDGTFNFTITPPAGGISSTSITTVGSTGSATIPNVVSGTYIITEAGQTGWTGTTGTTTVVPPGGTGFVAFFNTDLGTLIIDKITTGDNGTFDFTITPPAGGTASVSITTVGGTGSATIPNVVSGTYNIIEVGQTGWTGTTGVSIIISPGSTGTATFTNTDLGTLIIDKITTGDNSTFNFTITPPAGGTGSISITTTGGTGSISIPNVVSGTYDITEAGQTGWTGTTGVIVTVPPGATATATFTNTDLGTLIIDKITTGDDSTFDYTISPPAGGTASVAITTVGGTGSVTIPNVVSGIYNIIEAGQTGWTGTTGVSIDVPPGATATATFTNTDLGTLIIDKTALGGDSTFDYTITPPAGGTASVAITTTGGTGSVSIPNVVSGIYSITEAGQTGWTGTTGASVDVPPGATATATFTNTKLGDLVIDKTTIGNDGTFNFTITPPAGGTASISITTAGSIGFIDITNVVPGTYTITEAGQTGWTGTTGTITVVPPGGTGFAEFTNTDLGTLIINKTALGGDSTFDYTITPTAGGTASVAITTTGGTGSATILNVVSGTYNITEAGQTGWTGTTGVSVDVSPGATATATFTNTALSTLTISKSTSNGLDDIFQFVLTYPSGATAGASITTVGGTGSFTFTGLLPGQYNSAENPITAGWSVAPSSVTSNIAAGTNNTAAFLNTPTT